VGCGEAVSTCLRKYATFEGRASRPEYWWFALFGFIVSRGGIIDGLAHTFILGLVVGLALLLPSIAVRVRRLHDTGRSGWWSFIVIIPLIGAIWLIVLLCPPSTAAADTPYGAKSVTT
jgi:uncharacterized membrane protein YhaH (DUF805 family)